MYTSPKYNKCGTMPSLTKQEFSRRFLSPTEWGCPRAYAQVRAQWIGAGIMPREPDENVDECTEKERREQEARDLHQKAASEKALDKYWDRGPS